MAVVEVIVILVVLIRVEVEPLLENEDDDLQNHVPRLPPNEAQQDRDDRRKAGPACGGKRKGGKGGIDQIWDREDDTWDR
jgi:hypothetical protein